MTNDQCRMTNGGRIILIIKTLLLIVSLLIVNSAAYAQSTTVVSASDDSTQFNSSVGGMSIGYVKVGSVEVGNIAWHPDFKLGPWGLGLDVNVALSENKPADYEHVVMRYVEYDDGKRGLRYGVIDSLTWGHGLLLDGYSTRLTSSVLLNNSMMAAKGYLDMGQYVIRALTTKTGVNAIRAEERVNPLLTLGQTYITDSDGVTIPGTTTNQRVSGLGVDATVPMPFNFEYFAEYAQLVDHGGGLGTGVSWGQDFMVAAADFTLAYRLLDNRFVPGYFNADYETNPVNLTSAEATGNAKNGWLGKLGIKALGLATLNVRYENYNESAAALNADLSAKLPQEVEVTGYYQQPSFADFRSLTLEEGAILGGSIAYPVNPYTKVVMHVKRYYDSSTQQVVEDQYYEMQLNF